MGKRCTTRQNDVPLPRPFRLPSTMRATVPALAIAGLLAGAAFPAMAELGPYKRDARETPLCGSGKGAARVVRNTMSPDKKFALAWRDPDKDPGDVTEDDTDLELLLIRLADGVVLAKGDTDYFRNPGVTANRREELAIWSPDSRMVIRQLDPLRHRSLQAVPHRRRRRARWRH